MATQERAAGALIDSQRSAGYFEIRRMSGYGTTACVKVCGWRPHHGGAAHTGAGVRKPPREETAGSVERPRVRRYGDFGAGGVLPKCVERLFWEAIEGATKLFGRSR